MKIPFPKSKCIPGISVALYILLNAVSAQTISLSNKNLAIDINPELQTQIRALFPGSRKLMNGYSGSEYLETKYFSVKDFSFVRKENHLFRDAAGEGTE